MRHSSLAQFGLALSFCIAAAQAVCAGQTESRIRGSILAISPHQITVNDRTGEAVSFILDDATHYVGEKPVALTAIQPGSYIGCATVPAGGGTLRALEVTVFPPSMQGAGEGHYAWDLLPHSSMTNGTVGHLSHADGEVMTVTYDGGEQKIRVPHGVPIVTVEPGTLRALHPGVKVLILPAKGAPGHAARILYGEQGITPPQ
ncbi:MAG TPA: hypothetical protein VL752_11335 [Acidisoma sp.]|uniref:hypothetical protein n=1 Tax=Acidisoma sp. TaxID=1872115 RepID=UPI002C5C252A|nr:hypothetical protein [Acidisoma sp.]HTI01528.1 hypothetical protein [Acidisoma sp.]